LNNITTYIAIYAAVISTLLLILRHSDYRRDRGALRIHMMIGILIPGPMDKNYLTFTIANVGRRPINVRKVGGIYWWGKPKGFVINFTELPHELQEGQVTNLMTEHFDDILRRRGLRYICAYDSAGKKWKVGLRQIWRTRKAYRKLVREGRRPA